MSTHTPGRWIADLSCTNGHCGFSIDCGTRLIATVYAQLIKAPAPPGGIAALPENVESIANARLIAETPNMLKALQWAMVYLPRFPLPADDQELRDIYAENLEFCTQVLARAEGRP